MKNHQSSNNSVAKIPPPPGLGASYDELIAYHARYTLDELEQAGYAKEPTPEHVKEVSASADYWLARRNGIHLKLTPKECEKLSLLAAEEDISVEQLAKKWLKQRLTAETKMRTTRAGRK